MSSIFLSHCHSDKPFARRIANDLKNLGIRVWIDDAEIKIGDSLIEKIRAGIDQMEYVGVILSAKSVESEWVKKEVDIAMNQEIEGQRVKVLPLLVDDCELPGFLKGKLYADFRKPDSYNEEFTKLSDRLGVKAPIKQSKPVTPIQSPTKKKTLKPTISPQSDLVDRLLNARIERENKEEAEKREAEKK